jgi:hypothetical protein
MWGHNVLILIWLGLNVLCCPNGVGKTTSLDAIGPSFALASRTVEKKVGGGLGGNWGRILTDGELEKASYAFLSTPSW